jgi:ribosomal protein S4
MERRKTGPIGQSVQPAVVAEISIDVQDRAFDTAMVVQYCGNRLHMLVYQIRFGNSNRDAS